MKVKVAEFRNLIDMAFDSINIHWNSCVSDQERIFWFVSSFERFNNLSKVVCSTAKDQDKRRFEQVLDLFSTHCQLHEKLWVKSRAYVIMFRNGVDSTEALNRALYTESEILKLSVIMPENMKLGAL